MQIPANKPKYRTNPFALVLMSAGVIIILVSLAFLLTPKTGQKITPPRLGSKMSDFKLQNLDGKMVQLSDFAGKTVLINTWATWCPPCRAEMPDLETFYEKYQDQNFILLAINAGESAPTVRDFVKEFELTLPVLLDSDYNLMDSLGIDSFPTSILVGADGIIKHIQVGMFLQGELDKEIAPLLKN